MNDTDDILIASGGANPGDVHLLSIVRAVDEGIIGYLKRRERRRNRRNTMPIGLSDAELRLIMSAAASIRYEKRSVFLIAVARELGRDHQTSPTPKQHQLEPAR